MEPVPCLSTNLKSGQRLNEGFSRLRALISDQALFARNIPIRGRDLPSLLTSGLLEKLTV